MSGIFVNGLFTLAVIFAYAYGQRELGIEVYGDSVVQTDIRTYTIYTGNVYGTKSVTIKCISLVSLPSTLLLLKNNDVLGQSSGDEYYSYTEVTVELRYRWYNRLSHSGVYVCRINFTIPVNGVLGSFFEYKMESKLTIETDVSTICASSIGYWSYVGENGSISCAGQSSRYYKSYNVEGRWSEASNYYQPLGFTVSRNYNSFRIRCRQNRNYNYWYYSYCESPSFRIHPILEVELLRINNTDNSSTMEFICRSTPPRLMYWEIIGKNGNILDLYRLNKRADGCISIQHSVRNTSIQISRSIYLKQDIHTVLCSTYGTRARAMAYASLPSVDTCECEENIHTSPSYDQTSQEDLGTTTTHGTILHKTQLQTTESVAPPFPRVTPISREAVKLEQLTVRCNILTGAVAFLLTIIFILIVVICYTIHRLKKRSDMENYLKGTDLEGPELHNNPVYLAFSEPSDSAHSARDEENELNYANL